MKLKYESVTGYVEEVEISAEIGAYITADRREEETQTAATATMRLTRWTALFMKGTTLPLTIHLNPPVSVTTKTSSSMRLWIR